MDAIALKPESVDGTIAFKPVRPSERWPRSGLGPAAPLKDRSELPKAVANVLESTVLDRVTPVQRARLAVQAKRRGPGLWRDERYGVERFVPAPRAYQPVRRYHSTADAEAVESGIDGAIVAYESLRPEDASTGTGPTEQTIEHRIGEAVARIVASGMAVLIEGTPETYLVAQGSRMEGGKRVVRLVGISNPDEPEPITARRILDAIRDMESV